MLYFINRSVNFYILLHIVFINCVLLMKLKLKNQYNKEPLKGAIKQTYNTISSRHIKWLQEKKVWTLLIVFIKKLRVLVVLWLVSSSPRGGNRQQPRVPPARWCRSDAERRPRRGSRHAEGPGRAARTLARAPGGLRGLWGAHSRQVHYVYFWHLKFEMFYF